MIHQTWVFVNSDVQLSYLIQDYLLIAMAQIQFTKLFTSWRLPE